MYKSINVCTFIYIVNFLQDQRTDPSTFSFNVELAQLMLISLDQIDFLDGVVVTHPMEKVFDSILHRPFKGVKGIDIDGVAIFRDRGLITGVRRL